MSRTAARLGATKRRRLAEDTPPPADANAERATLGSILLDRDAIIPVAPWLFADHFFVEKHAWIYEAQLACYNRRIPPDLVNVTDELRRQQRLEHVGGVGYLIELSNSVPTAVHVEYYGRIVERTAIMRRLIDAGGAIGALGYDESLDPLEALGQAEAILGAIGQHQADDMISFNDLADRYHDRLMRLKDRGDAMTGIPSGFAELDKITGGLQKSDLLILAARPAVGKTAFALNVAANAAATGARVAVFSLEMGQDQLMDRMVATETGLDLQRLRNGRITDDDIQAVTDAVGKLSALNITMVDNGGLSIMDVRSRCRQMANEEAGLDLVVIDYLQLMRGTGSKRGDENRVQEVSEISRGLKTLARELNVPIIALSQLSRAVETRTSKVPMLSDLRESGSLEQDADIVLFIYREELYDPDTDKKGIAELHIAKHRNGATGVVPMRFFKSITKFANLETYRHPEGY